MPMTFSAVHARLGRSDGVLSKGTPFRSAAVAPFECHRRHREVEFEHTPRTGDAPSPPDWRPRLKLGSIYRLLADHGHEMFGDDYFADLYSDSVRGRPTIPARVVATVMLLQAHEGLSDREACDRLGFDLRWQAAAGVDTGAEAFHPTVLQGQRNRLRASVRPRRLFEDTKVVAMTTRGAPRRPDATLNPQENRARSST
jgi:hypothetical protein